MSKTILITGASGLIGKALTHSLLKKGYQVSHLGRKEPKEKTAVKFFKWDVYKKEIDENCLRDADIIVHLAGEGIADKRWTSKRKEAIVKSRTESIKLIYQLLEKGPHQVKAVISASGINYYGDQGDRLLTEDLSPAGTFLGSVCKVWEEAVDEGQKFGLRIVKMRTGIVLDKDGGALPELARPIQFGFGAPLGTGAQWVSWIHLDDAVAMYVFAIEKEINGSFNMCTPDAVTNRELTKAVAKQLKKPLWLPAIPAPVLNIVLGEMKAMVLESVKASSSKIQAEGFEYKFPELEAALADIYND